MSESRTAYPPLEEVRKTVRPRWYRSPIDKQRLRELCERSDREGFVQAGGHLALYLLLATLTVVFWTKGLWWLFFLSLWCLGFVASFFKGTSVHELGHGTVFRSRQLNRVFLYLLSLIGWWDPFDYASSHTYHHRYTTYPEADRENLLPLEPSLRPGLLLQLFTLNLFTRPGRNFGKGGLLWTVYLTVRRALGVQGGLSAIASQEWLERLHEDQPEAYRQSVLWSRVLIAFHGSVLLLALLTGLWVLPLVVSVAAYIANCGSYFFGVTQHCGLRENVPDFRKNTRSIQLPRPFEFLYWHMNWHTEHHMYAGVPCYHLKSLARELADDMPEPQSLVGAWKEMRKIHRQQQHDPDYEFDRPVPPPNNDRASDSDEALAASIGDLAPQALKSNR